MTIAAFLTGKVATHHSHTVFSITEAVQVLVERSEKREVEFSWKKRGMNNEKETKGLKLVQHFSISIVKGNPTNKSETNSETVVHVQEIFETIEGATLTSPFFFCSQ